MLYQELALRRDSDEIVSRWAPVMLNADAYAEIIDRHVELAAIGRRVSSGFKPPSPPAASCHASTWRATWTRSG